MKDVYAIVTGASSGIGKEFAVQLAQKGYNLVVVARREERLNELKAEIESKFKVKVKVIAHDLAHPRAGIELYDKIEGDDLSVEILVNNAGVGIQGRFIDMDLGQVETMFRLNMHSLTELTLLFAKNMVGRGKGYILQVSSLSAFLPTPVVSPYAASKAYVLSFGESLWYELRGTGVSVSTLYPGITTTEFEAVSGAKHPPMMNMSVLSAAEVARVGLKGMFKGKRAIIPGIINKLSAFFTTVLPRGMIVKMTGKLMSDANKD